MATTATSTSSTMPSAATGSGNHTRTTDAATNLAPKAETALIFPDILDNYQGKDDDVSLAFFELANAPEFVYRLPKSNKPNLNLNISKVKGSMEENDTEGNGQKLPQRERKRQRKIQSRHKTAGTIRSSHELGLILRQDVLACGEHTGGIVWETSFLLLEYLLSVTSPCTGTFTSSTTTSVTTRRSPGTNANASPSSSALPTPPILLGRTLEVGAGCGLLGMALAAQGRCSQMVLTETAQVLTNLQANVERNRAMLAKNQEHQKKLTTSNNQSTSDSSDALPSSMMVHTACLDWTNLNQDVTVQPVLLKPRSFDCILGTDILFRPSLVEPLLRTLQYMIRPASTTSNIPSTPTPLSPGSAGDGGGGVIYLCVQIRCAASHDLFLKSAPKYGFQLEDISQEYQTVPACAFGADLECVLWKLVPLNL